MRYYMTTEVGPPINRSTPVLGHPYYCQSDIAKRDLFKTGERTRDEWKNKTLKQLWRAFTKLAKDFRKSGNRVKMGNIASEISKKLTEVLLKQTHDNLETTYIDVKGVTSRALGYEPRFGHVDKKVLTTLKKSKPLYDAYAGLSKDLSGDLNKIIADSYQLAVSPGMDEMRKVMEQRVGLSKSRLNTIVRSEMGLVSNLAKFQSYEEYDPDHKRKYTWKGPPWDPRRSSDHCQFIKDKIKAEGGSVTLPRVLELMEIASNKYNGPKWKYRKGLVHVNCRHTPEEVADVG